MSTLVVLGVVLLAIAGVLHLVLDQPDQPPTIRLIPTRANSGGAGADADVPAAADERVAVAVALGHPAAPGVLTDQAAVSVAPAVAEPYPADVYPAALPVIVVEVSTADDRRVRSAVTLMMLVAAMGVAVAVLVVAVILGAAAVVTRGAT